MQSFHVLRILAVLAWVISLSLQPSASYAFELSKPCPTFDWKHLPPNQWIQVTTCNQSPPKVFHGASALASDKRTVFFFGADTHEKDYDNSVYRLNLTNLRWEKDYEADSLANYRVTPQGHPVTSTNRPWAMHTFDGWDYDPVHNLLILVGTPKHATRPIQRLKDQGTFNHPIQPTTWHYDPETHTWALIATPTPNLFAGGLVWDLKRKQFIGHDGLQTYHYTPQDQTWKTYASSSVPGYHLRLVYDTLTHSTLSLGNNTNSHELWSYTAPSRQWKKINVSHPPLPANGAAMAYNSRHHVLVYVANHSPTPYSNPSGKSVTFIYSHKHGWVRLPIKSPPLFGMNYLTQYDPVTDMILHFEKAGTSHKHMALWVFRYHPS